MPCISFPTPEQLRLLLRCVVVVFLAATYFCAALALVLVILYADCVLAVWTRSLKPEASRLWTDWTGWELFCHVIGTWGSQLFSVLMLLIFIGGLAFVVVSTIGVSMTLAQSLCLALPNKEKGSNKAKIT